MKVFDIFESPEVTNITIEHKGNLFFGEAIVAPEDKDSYSAIFGGRLAETRAYHEALKFRLAEARLELHTLDNLLKACSNTKKFNREEDSAKVLFHQYNIKKKQVEQLKNQVKAIKDSIKLMIDDREKYIKKLEANRTKADKE